MISVIIIYSFCFRAINVCLYRDSYPSEIASALNFTASLSREGLAMTKYAVIASPLIPVS